jgi:ATP-binding cassette, subfamily B (MDR/TAP), member 1
VRPLHPRQRSTGRGLRAALLLRHGRQHHPNIYGALISLATPHSTSPTPPLLTLRLNLLPLQKVVLTGAFLIGGAAPNFGTIAAAQAAAFKIIEIIKRSPPIDVKSEDGLVPGRDGAPPLQGRIEFRNVRFAYPSRPDTLILDDFNLVIEPQQNVALVGPSGSGKSSIILLIQRFYDVQAGEILIDGRNIREYNVRCGRLPGHAHDMQISGLFSSRIFGCRFLRELIGTVSQEPQLFAISVKANISLGKPSSQGPASQEEITSAATAANAHKFIQSLQVTSRPV